MLNKKLLGLLVAGMVSLSAVGCQSTVSEPVSGTTEVTQDQAQELGLVLIDNEICTVTITEKYEDPTMCEVGYKVEIVNNSDKNILVGTNADTSVNGVMNEYNTFATEVTAGNKAITSWYFVSNVEEQNVKCLADLVNVKFTLMVWDNDTFDTLSEASVEIN